MDVTPPLTAGQPARRSATPAAPVLATPPSRIALALRRTGTAVAVLAVAALAAAACTLSFEPLRSLAVTGGARTDLAYLYPAGFAALLVVALISVFLLRTRGWAARLQAGVVLAVLIVAAATANTVVATGAVVDSRAAAVTVAIAPWVMVVLGLWLLLLSVRAPRAAGGESDADLVPFGVERTTAEPLSTRDREPSPVPDEAVAIRAPELAPPLEESVTPEEREAVARQLPEAEPVVGPTPAPETPPVDRTPAPQNPEPARRTPVVTDPERTPVLDDPAPPAGRTPVAHSPEPPAGRTPVPESPEPLKDQPLVPEPRRREPDAPLRWGDLVRPASGDVLVHPLPSSEDVGTQPYPAFTGADEYDPGRYVERDDERDPEPTPAEVDRDTQPYPNLREESPRLPATGQEPDPAHGAWVAEPEEIAVQDEAGPAQRRPHPAEEAAAPPSGRMRSTPLPPEE
ncbi:hypothetical protein GCM10009677_21660 [Sphaerisporangium rubeum]|uniref:DUF2637 domain-containing protein n=1 Tax=Sphaerisporangium rubeum TaxID=321317 RepID=A0A7X0IC09_9ACTN|nr:DUF2637 domain-containing protein [Sphaerisporangium rubeum]MBB6471729.1 hypothetical protein [Sphaerisporangium rubeum]